MNNQVKLIDADKILWELAYLGFMTDDIKRKIENGEFDPDTRPVPIIKPGDKVLITMGSHLKGKELKVSAHHAHKKLISVIAEDGLWNIGYGGFELLEVVE